MSSAWSHDEIPQILMEFMEACAGADPEIFQSGGVVEENFERKMLIHVSMCEHIKTRQTCNSFSLLPFQKDCLLFFALFYYSLLFLKFERWGLQPP